MILLQILTQYDKIVRLCLIDKHRVDAKRGYASRVALAQGVNNAEVGTRYTGYYYRADTCRQRFLYQGILRVAKLGGIKVAVGVYELHVSTP